MEAYGGLSIDQATNVRAVGCKFMGTYALKGADVQASKGITVTSKTASVSSNIIFESCLFTKFARLVDLSFDAIGIKFTNCDFDKAYYLLNKAINYRPSKETKLKIIDRTSDVLIAMGQTQEALKFLQKQHKPNLCSKKDINIEYADNLLTIKSVKDNNTLKKDSDDGILHKGISKRFFSKTFTIADDTEVKSAELKDGLLKVSLERIIPEAKKPKVIKIQ